MWEWYREERDCLFLFVFVWLLKANVEVWLKRIANKGSADFLANNNLEE